MIKSLKIKNVFIFLFILIGIVLRVEKIISTQLYRDEVYDLFWSQSSSLRQLLSYNYWDTFHPPAYFIFLKYWQLISIDPLFIRLPGVFSFLITSILLVILAKKISPRSFLLSFILVVLFSFSSTQLTINILARQYILVIPLMVLSLIMFIEILEGDKSKKLYFTIVTLMAFFADYSSIWLILSYCLCVLFGFVAKKRYKQILFPITIITMTIFFWVFLFMIEKIGFFSSVLNKNYPSGGFSIIDNLLNYIAWFTGIDLPQLAINSSITRIVEIFFLVFGYMGLVYYMKKGNKYIGILLIIILTVPVIISLIITKFLLYVFVHRNLIFVNIAFMFGYSLFLYYLLRSKRLILIIIGIMLLIVYILNPFFNFNKLYYHENYDWIKLTIYAHKALKKSKSVVISIDPLYMYSPIAYYSNFYGQINGQTIVSDFTEDLTVYNRIIVVDFLEEYPNDIMLIAINNIRARNSMICNKVTLDSNVLVYQCDK